MDENVFFQVPIFHRTNVEIITAPHLLLSLEERNLYHLPLSAIETFYFDNLNHPTIYLMLIGPIIVKNHVLGGLTYAKKWQKKIEQVKKKVMLNGYSVFIDFDQLISIQCLF